MCNSSPGIVRQNPCSRCVSCRGGGDPHLRYVLRLCRRSRDASPRIDEIGHLRASQGNRRTALRRLPFEQSNLRVGHESVYRERLPLGDLSLGGIHSSTTVNSIRRHSKTIDRVPQTGERGIYLKKQLRDKLIEHKRYIDLHGEDLPEIRNWIWGAKRVGRNQIADLPQNPELGAAWRRRFVLFHQCRGKGRRKGLEPGLSVPRWLCVN